MTNVLRAAAFCVVLLTTLSAFLLHTSAAKEDMVAKLLLLPAPPPANPLVPPSRERGTEFYNKSKPPADNASTEDLLDYWRNQSETYQKLRYMPEPSDRSLGRIKKEIERDHKKLLEFLNLFIKEKDGADFVKDIYDSEGTTGVFDKDQRSVIKSWLTYNSPFFSNDLLRGAQQVSDADNYVTNQEELLALAKFDFDKAKPLIDRLLADSSSRVSQALAKWALYKHAIETDSLGDIERFRDELKAIVEDKNNPDGMRDIAMDALSSEKEWTGRDDWYYGLLEDPTLVGMQRFTGLTTLPLMSPDEKYIEKMIELLKSGNPVVRGAAIRNLTLRIDTGNIEIVRALLPWLEDPKWAVDSSSVREQLVYKLAEIEMPESVPGLIQMLNESATRPGSNSNVAANAVRPATPVRATNPDIKIATTITDEYIAPALRGAAVRALAKQKDGRAVPALRRILPEGEDYEKTQVIGAILACGGFTISEQMDALESAAKGVRDEMDTEENPVGANTFTITNTEPANYNYNAAPRRNRPFTAAEIKAQLAIQLVASSEISNELAGALVNRIEGLDKTNPRLSAAFRKMALRWQNSVINALMLRDVKNDIANVDTVVRLLSQRKTLRENQTAEVVDAGNGSPVGKGIAACILDEEAAYAGILDSDEALAKTAMFACARMIRAVLPIAKVAESLNSTDKRLITAAERYLESEDSPEARALVLARHPNEARITGASSAFYIDGSPESYSEYLYLLYASVGDNSLYNGWGGGEIAEIKATENRLQDEVKKTPELLGVYYYDVNYIRIYSDRVIFSWDEDENRYRERALTEYEFNELKTHLTDNNVDSLKPFLGCGGEYCISKELLMLGKNGGRRVFVSGEGYDFFIGLDKYFTRLKEPQAAVKYAMSRDIPGLELVLADDDKHIDTVWKEGSDLIVVVSDMEVRKKVDDEIEAAVNGEDGQIQPETESNEYELREKLKAKREWEGYSWHKVTGGILGDAVAQPPLAEYIPPKDSLTVPPDPDRWKARVGAVEIRTSPEGLYKVSGGRITKIRDGLYLNPFLTPAGRWLLVNKSNEENVDSLMRVDLSTNREYRVDVEGYGRPTPRAYIPTLNKVLIAYQSEYEDYLYETNEDRRMPDTDPDSMFLIDAATGAMQPTRGEYRPLSQQTFRPLQKTTRPNEFWAAIIDAEKGSTRVGIYDTKVFGFKPLLTLPKIAFNSMDMFVDEPAQKVYFVYRGHLLAVPLPK